jgi:hypothetical protein
VKAFILFAYLQVLDLMTTLAFLSNRVAEANPLVRYMLKVGPSPLATLIVVKAAAFALGIYCIRSSRLRLLSRVNFGFGALVVWNLFVLIISGPQISG